MRDSLQSPTRGGLKRPQSLRPRGIKDKFPDIKLHGHARGERRSTMVGLVKASQRIPPRGRHHDRRPKCTAAESQAIKENCVAAGPILRTLRSLCENAPLSTGWWSRALHPDFRLSADLNRIVTFDASTEGLARRGKSDPANRLVICLPDQVDLASKTNPLKACAAGRARALNLMESLAQGPPSSPNLICSRAFHPNLFGRRVSRCPILLHEGNMAITITSASYDATSQTLQITVSADQGQQVYAYTGDAAADNASAVMLASGTAGSGNLTLSIANVSTNQLSTYLNVATLAAGKLYVCEALGALKGEAITYPASAALTAAKFNPLTATIAQSAASTGTQASSDTITVTASAGSGVASVAISDTYNNTTTALGTATKQADGSYTFTAANLAEGSHTLTAVATDNLGATSTKTIIDKVDLTAPVISAPILQTGGSSDGTQSTSDTITVTVTDPDNGKGNNSGVKSVEIFDGTKDVGAATLSNGTWSKAVSGLAPGSHTFTAVATDNAGNVSPSSYSPTVTDLVQPTGVNSIAQTASGTNWNQSTSDTIIVTASSTGSSVKSVEIYDTVSGATTATDLGAATLSNGVWTYNATGLADGKHTFNAVATDNAGNASTLASSSSLAVSDKVDHTAPVISAVTQSVTGAWTSGSDTITVTAGDGTGSGGVLVDIYDGTTDLGAATNNNDGTWSKTVSGLAAGAHTFAAVATDALGNASTLASSQTVNVLVQPTGVNTISQSASNSTSLGPNTIWSSSSSDVITVTPSSTNTVTAVEIYDGTTDLGAATNNNDGTWSKTVSGLANGSHTFAAVVTDNKGNPSTLASSPTVTDLVQPTGVTVSSGAHNWNSSTSDTIGGTASSTNTLKSVEIFDGTKDLGGATVTGNNWSYNATNLADGVHTFAAIATDNLGNSSTLAFSQTVIDKVDTTAPVITGIAQSEASAGTSSGTDKITVAVSDGSNGSGVASVTIYDGTSPLAGSATDNGDGTWSYTAGSGTALTEGAHSFRAVAADKAGNSTLLAFSPSVTDLVDKTIPVAVVSQSATDINSGWNKVASDTITVSAIDALSGVKSVTITEDSAVVPVTLAATSGSYTFNNLTDGAHTFTVTVTDNAGKQTLTPLSEKVDATGPALTIAQTGGSITGTQSKSDTITVTASDALSGLSSVTLKADGTSVSLTNGVYSATNLTDGVHTFIATATDAAGNVTTKTLTDVVDTTAPVVVSLAGTPSGTFETITGKVTDATSGVASVAIYDNNGTNNVWVGSTAVDASGNFTLVEAGITEGAHTFTAVATDNAGNASKAASSPTITVQVDHTPPVVSAAQTASGSWTQSTSDTITVSASDTGSGVKSVEIYDNGKDVSAALQQKDGSWAYTASKLTDGAHSFTAVATDNAGNATTSSQSLIDQVDTTPPVLTIADSEPKPWTKSTSDTITVTASDTGSGVKSVEIYDNGKDVSAAVQQKDGSWTYTASKLADGTHTFDAVVTDNAGNASTLPSSKAVTDQVDTTVPVISTIGQTGSSTGTQSTTDTITVTASDGNGSGVKSVEIYDGSKDLGAALQVGTTNSWTFTAGAGTVQNPTLAVGSHTFDAVVTDNAGNASTLPSSKAAIDLVTAAGPVVSAIVDSEPKPWTKSTTDTITVTATSATGTVKSVEIYDSGKDLGAAVQVGTSNNWTFNAGAGTAQNPTLADGVHTFDAVVTDSASNVSTLPSSKAVIDQVDTTAPTIGSPSQNVSGAWTKSNSDTITVAASDGGSGIASVHIYDGQSDLGAATLSNGSYVLTASNLSDGKHVFTAKATDNAGNTTSSASSGPDLVDHNGVPVVGSISETVIGSTVKFGQYKFDVSNLIGGTAGPDIGHVAYWIDKSATATSEPTSGSHWTSSLSLDNKGTVSETLTINNTGHVGDYLHVQAVDTLGHTSTIGTKQIA